VAWPRLYDTDLMLGGSHVSGHAVDAARAARAARALDALAPPQAFAQRHGVAPGTPPMLFALGDGNHSLATAKSIREQVKARVDMDHPSRPRRGTQGARQDFGLIIRGRRFAVIEIAEPPSSSAVGTLHAFVAHFVEAGGAALLDYAHGDEVLARLAQVPGSAGLHRAGRGQHELLRCVVLEGPLPRKTFSMREAHGNRCGIEARRIR
jgi:hypothetical protein